MWDKLIKIEHRYDKLGDLLSQPEIINDRNQYQKLSKEHKDLSEAVASVRACRKAKEELEASRELANSTDDKEMREMALEESKLLAGEIEGLEKQLKLFLLPKDPNDDKNVIVEIRAGTGGDEAAIFVGDLYKMLSRYSEARGWKIEMMSCSDSSQGGYKEVILMINGQGAYSRLKFESGVHRVQRVPDTETQGRIHTSTVTVAVLPEVEEVEIEIREVDLRIEVFRAGGPGGQSVNTTDSAVRMTHIPTGLVVSMQDEKSQLKNRAKALKVLRARLYEKKQAEVDAERSANRRSQVGTGDRSERIRTYNFPQSRVTDHRIGLTLYSLNEVMYGDLDQLIDPLIIHWQTEALKNQSDDVTN